VDATEDGSVVEAVGALELVSGLTSELVTGVDGGAGSPLELMMLLSTTLLPMSASDRFRDSSSVAAEVPPIEDVPPREYWLLPLLLRQALPSLEYLDC